MTSPTPAASSDSDVSPASPSARRRPWEVFKPGARRADNPPVMVRTGDGFSTCREHGGSFAGDLGAYDHLEREHPALFAQLTNARAVPVPEGADPADVIAQQQPNRAARRRAARHAR